MSRYFDPKNMNSPQWTGSDFLVNPVYDEIQFSAVAGKAPAVGAPSYELMSTTCSSYAFGPNENLDAPATELPHWWVEGTSGDAHIHFAPKTAQSSGADRFVKWTVTFAMVSFAGTVTEVAKTAEFTIPTGTGALKHCYLDLGDVDFSGYTLGSQLQCNIKRIAATGGTEYADDVYVFQVGIHLLRNRFGSHDETASGL